MMDGSTNSVTVIMLQCTYIPKYHWYIKTTLFSHQLKRKRTQFTGMDNYGRDWWEIGDSRGNEKDRRG